MKYLLKITFIAIMVSSCSDTGISPEERDLNFILRYGITAKNVLNTFENTYTKDLIEDGTITIPFHLTDDEFDQILNKMNDIDFFNYPDTLVIALNDHIPRTGMVYSYELEVIYHSIFKGLRWWYDGDAFYIQNLEPNERKELLSLVTFIREIIESKPEYEKLPPPRGGYD